MRRYRAHPFWTAGRPLLSGWRRVAAAVAGGGVLTLLLLAARLDPDPAGFGTHRQLGLPRCSFFELVGVRCPACGMTTSWANLLHGRTMAAVRANMGGVMLAVGAMVVAPWLLISSTWGRWIVRPPGDRMTAIWSIALAAVILSEWLLRLLS